MTPLPADPKIYHITHVNNLAGILADRGLLCDREMALRAGPSMTIGMSSIKRRRVEELGVACYPGTKVGDYVPFYFCPRSVMLFVIHRANHPELTFREGQGQIVHLEANVHKVIEWAEAHGQRWAFSLSNAGARYTEFRARIQDLDQLDWTAIRSTDFRDQQVKERKQAEFLLRERFPFELVERIGVASTAIHARAAAALADSDHRPAIEVRPEWYF